MCKNKNNHKKAKPISQNVPMFFSAQQPTYWKWNNMDTIH